MGIGQVKLRFIPSGFYCNKYAKVNKQYANHLRLDCLVSFFSLYRASFNNCVKGRWLIFRAWNHTTNIHLATTSLSNELKFWAITFL